MAEQKPKIDELLKEETIEKVTSEVTSFFDMARYSYQQLIEIGIIAVGIFVAWFVSNRLQVLIAEHEEKSKSKAKRILFFTLGRLIFPLLLFGWVGVFAIGFAIFKQDWPVLLTAINLVVAWFIIRLGSSFIENPLISRTVASVIWVIAALNITGYLTPVVDFLDQTKIELGQTTVSLYAIVSSLISIAIFLWIAFALIKLVDNILKSSKNISLSARALLSKTFKFTLVAAAFIFGLGAVGIDLTAFAVLGGAIGVGIGFGLQKIFSNLISGFILLLDKSIKPGDTINVAGQYGRVETLSSRYVSVITRDGIEHLVPNEEMIISRVENWSYSHDNLRLRIPVGIHYKSDVNKAIELCLEAAADVQRVMTLPKPACLMKGFGDSSVDLEIRIWIRDPMSGCSNVKSEVLLGVWNKFHEHGIEIPYPQRDLHLRSISKESIADLNSAN
ncbi:MAG: mechanosensitive ion channel [Gammaproteobacteria bacterium]|nr:mechanosensitive ion channel [Gammaproteobacteria bacterium]